MLCVSEGSAKHGRCCELDALLSGTGNLETAAPASSFRVVWPYPPCLGQCRSDAELV